MAEFQITCHSTSNSFVWCRQCSSQPILAVCECSRYDNMPRMVEHACNVESAFFDHNVLWYHLWITFEGTIAVKKVWTTEQNSRGTACLPLGRVFCWHSLSAADTFNKTLYVGVVPAFFGIPVSRTCALYVDLHPISSFYLGRSSLVDSWS